MKARICFEDDRQQVRKSYIQNNSKQVLTNADDCDKLINVAATDKRESTEGNKNK